MANQQKKSIVDWDNAKCKIEGDVSILHDLAHGLNMKWHDVRDKRPNHLQRCICFDKYFNESRCYVYDDKSKYWCSATTEEHDPNGDNHVSDYADRRITHWMSMPESPKGGAK